MSFGSQHRGRLTAVIERSRPLSKRIERKDSVHIPPRDGDVTFIENWQSVISNVDSVFETRLALDGLTRQTASYVVADSGPPDTEETALLECLIEVLGASGAAIPTFRSQTPFFELLYPFASWALSGLDYRLWSSNAKNELLSEITDRLSGIAAPTLLHEFTCCRKSNDAQSRLEYRRFVEALQVGGWMDLFETYPVLARLLATESRKWFRMFAEAESRLRRDCEFIQRGLSIPAGELFPIAGAVPMGDMHNGRCVLALTATSGIRLLYKPRSMMLERWLNDLFQTMNDTSTACYPRFSTLCTISCDGYGYQEFIQQKNCEDKAAVSRAFCNYGGLLGALHLLGATDGHFENIVVAGEHPYFIDAETLLQSDSLPFSFRDTRGGIPHTFSGDYWLPGVQRVGILPSIHLVSDSTDESGAVDFSALGYVNVRKVRLLRFAHINTDGMAISESLEDMHPLANAVRLDSVVIPPAAHGNEIVAGYRDAIECLKQVVTREVLEKLSGLRSRSIFRSTNLYARAIWRSIQPDNLTSGLRHSLVFEPLAIAFCVDGGAPDRWEIFKEEVSQLENMDIPVFQRDTSGRSLYCGASGKEISGFFADTGIEAAQRRLSFTTSDLDRDIRIIKDALATTASQHRTPSVKYRVHVHEDSGGCSHQQGCRMIVEHLLRTAVISKNGSVNWICRQKAAQSERFAYRPAGESFYNGKLGVACFLAAASRSFSDNRAEEVISGVLAEINEISTSRTWVKAAVNTFGGGITGAGGLLYGLLCLAQLTNDDSHIESAAIFASEIVGSGVQQRWGLDFFDGKSGLLFALARLQTTFPDSRFEAAMRSCVSSMLKESWAGDAARGAAANANSIPGGFAHGTAGVGLALVEAWRRMGDEEVLGLGKKCLHAAFRETCDSRSVMSQSVCRGTAGLSIVRHLVSDTIELPDVLSRQTPAERRVSPDMTLCCGRSGLWLAANMHDRQSGPAEKADQELPSLEFALDMHPCDDVSLFRGVSGIGWVLLEQNRSRVIPGLFEFGMAHHSGRTMQDPARDDRRIGCL